MAVEDCTAHGSLGFYFLHACAWQLPCSSSRGWVHLSAEGASNTAASSALEVWLCCCHSCASSCRGCATAATCTGANDSTGGIGASVSTTGAGCASAAIRTYADSAITGITGITGIVGTGIAAATAAAAAAATSGRGNDTRHCCCRRGGWACCHSRVLAKGGICFRAAATPRKCFQQHWLGCQHV